MSDHPAFKQIEHRPWPLPESKWLLKQRWLDLAFIHWEVSASEMRAKIPKSLDIDLYNGKAYVAVVPFDMKGVGIRGLPTVSTLSDFPEINVRTYVEFEGKKGVWFFSLDVPKRFTVWTAKTFFHLPYRLADVSVENVDGVIQYKHEMPGYEFEADYRPSGNRHFEAESFEVWATERYCLYCQSNRGQLYRTEVQHPQWALEVADISIRKNSLLDEFELGGQHPSVLFSKRLDVVAYPPRKLKS